MEAIKAKFFRSHPDDPVIFHRKEMLNAHPPFEALKDDELRRQFDEELLGLLAAWQYTVITVCLDKKKHKETYTTWRYDPYHYCLAVLLERFAYFLGREGARGDVMAESRGGKDDMRLKKSFVKLWEQGTQFVEPEQFQDRFTSYCERMKKGPFGPDGLRHPPPVNWITWIVGQPQKKSIKKTAKTASPPLI